MGSLKEIYRPLVTRAFTKSRWVTSSSVLLIALSTFYLLSYEIFQCKISRASVSWANKLGTPEQWVENGYQEDTGFSWFLSTGCHCTPVPGGGGVRRRTPWLGLLTCRSLTLGNGLHIPVGTSPRPLGTLRGTWDSKHARFSKYTMRPTYRTSLFWF